MYRIIILLVALTLTACVTPARLGISEEQWSNYSPEEQEKIKEGYREAKKVRAPESEAVAPDGSVVKLRISGGNVSMPPFTDTCQYTPVDLQVTNGGCAKVKIKELNGDKTVTMQVCYRNKTVYIDPSRFDPNKALGSIQLHYSPIWNRGFTYQGVSSTGYVHLTNANVVIRRYDNNEPTDSDN
jgi:hypothetical protein